MIQWKFYIDDIEYPQPESFTDLILGLKRDPDYHGVIFEASVGSIVFTGAARDYILEKEQTLGLKANIIFRADVRCDENGEFEEIIKGKLNMGKMEETCGTECSLSVPIEQENCTMLLRNRFDQKVDMDSLTAFDKVTVLEAYTYAGFNVTMPSKALQVGATGTVADEGDLIEYSLLPGGLGRNVYTRPSYLNKADESLVTSELEPSSYLATNDSNYGQMLVSPVILLEETIDCFNGDFTYDFRFKGHIKIATQTFIFGFDAWIRILKGTILETETDHLGYVPGSPTNGLTELAVFQLYDNASPEIDQDFDQSFSGTTTLEQGEGIWAYIYTLNDLNGQSDTSYVQFDKETSVNIQALRQCPESDATVYLVNEALSRSVEAVTNGCLKVKSDYYGRTDSQPYPSSQDGCGSLRLLNSGLQLRKAVDAKLFLSPKDCMEGLNAIDNIGFGLEPDPARPGFDVMRVEDVRYFYRNEEVLALRAAPNVKIVVQENEHYSKIQTGYQKWEVERVKGLDEFNSNREYRTSLSSVSNVLNIQSKFVAGSYPIEITRQQSYAASGAADTKYDNDTFIYCVTRQLYGFSIEQGNVSTPTNIFSASTIYNWRIRPYSNLQRWFKTVSASYPNIVDTDNKLFFSSGTGNYVASGEMTSVFCKPENRVKAENADMGQGDFNFLEEDPRPIWRPKTITFKYPLSAGEYKKIKASPYGYISVQCGTGEWLHGYIMSVQYSPTQGQGDFILKLKAN
jgi:hypothetical protein